MKYAVFMIGFYIAWFPSGLWAICSDELTCHQNIEHNTLTQRDLFNTHLLPLGNVGSVYRLRWQQFFEHWLQFGPVAGVYSATPHLTLDDDEKLYDEYLAMAERNTHLTQLKLNFLLQENVLPVTSQQIADLNITPNVTTPTFGFFPISVPPPDDDLINMDYLMTNFHVKNDENHLKREHDRLDLLSSTLNPMLINNPHANFSSRDEEQRFLLQAWQLLSQQSVILSNLYQILNQRIAISDAGKNMAISDQYTLSHDASVREISHYLAHYRVQDPAWSSAWEQRSELTLHKAKLYGYVALQHSLYQQYQAKERLLLLAVTQQIQSLGVLQLWRDINQKAEDAQNNGSSPQVPPTPDIPQIPPGNTSSPSGNSFPGGAHCFIATQVYGEGSIEVQAFREIRDQYLQHHDLGRWMVHGYYTFSPDVSEWLAQHPQWRAPVRWLLNAFLDEWQLCP